jgi:glucosamine-6-phosphate deaminase
MNLHVFSDKGLANGAAAEILGAWLESPEARNVIVAAGNTPLDLYARIAARRLALPRLHIFALDEYVGVPLEEPRNCANLIQSAVADAWGIPGDRFHTVSSLESEAGQSIRNHESLLENRGGADVTILGLGQNGHLGFNEPGSARDSAGRVLDLDAISTSANREWFDGRYAPCRGVTIGLKALLASRRILLMAYGRKKSAAVRAMVKLPANGICPASFLRDHQDVHVFLDEAAASELD